MSDWEKKLDDLWWSEWCPATCDDDHDIDDVKAFIRTLLEEERKSMWSIAFLTVRSQCADELEEAYTDGTYKLALATEIDNLIKKWRGTYGSTK